MTINVSINGIDTVNIQTYYGTVGTSATVILATLATTPPAPQTQQALRQFLHIHNPSITASLAFTLDGTSPVVNGQGDTLLPGGTATFEIKVPQGILTLIASASSSPYTILIM